MPRINWKKTDRMQRVEEGRMRAQARELEDTNPAKAERLKKAASDMQTLREHHNKIRKQYEGE